MTTQYSVFEELLEVNPELAAVEFTEPSPPVLTSDPIANKKNFSKWAHQINSRLCHLKGVVKVAIEGNKTPEAVRDAAVTARHLLDRHLKNAGLAWTVPKDATLAQALAHIEKHRVLPTVGEHCNKKARSWEEDTSLTYLKNCEEYMDIVSAATNMTVADAITHFVNG